MQNFVNYTPRQRGCLNITYDPDDFAFAMAVSMNDRVLYKNTISGKRGGEQRLGKVQMALRYITVGK